jgi:hypothetical protein
MEVELERFITGRKHLDDRWAGEAGEEQSNYARGRRHDEALDENLLNDPSAPGPNREAQ